MRLLASDSKLVEMSVNDGGVIRRSKDATFCVDDATGKSLVRGSEFAQVGTSMRQAQGYRCKSCGFLGVFRDRCGRCGNGNLEAE